MCISSIMTIYHPKKANELISSKETTNSSSSPFGKMFLFTSSGCIHCNQARTITKRVASQLGNSVVELDIETLPEIVDEKKIAIIPTLIIGEGNAEQRVTGGSFSEGEIIKAVFNASVR